MMPESITQEDVIEKVGKRLGTLDAKAEQAIAHACDCLAETVT